MIRLIQTPPPPKKHIKHPKTSKTVNSSPIAMVDSAVKSNLFHVRVAIKALGIKFRKYLGFWGFSGFHRDMSRRW